MGASMPSATSFSLEIRRLKKAADNYPIRNCEAPAHARHHAVLSDATRVCLTRNETRDRGERYYLSVQGREPLSDCRIHDILSLFLGEEFAVEEVWGITTPNVRCFSWPAF